MESWENSPENPVHELLRTLYTELNDSNMNFALGKMQEPEYWAALKNIDARLRILGLTLVHRPWTGQVRI